MKNKKIVIAILLSCMVLPMCPVRAKRLSGPQRLQACLMILCGGVATGSLCHGVASDLGIESKRKAVLSIASGLAAATAVSSLISKCYDHSFTDKYLANARDAISRVNSSPIITASIEDLEEAVKESSTTDKPFDEALQLLLDFSSKLRSAVVDLSFMQEKCLKGVVGIEYEAIFVISNDYLRVIKELQLEVDKRIEIIRPMVEDSEPKILKP